MERTVLLWMIPLNLLLVAWVWIGRLLFGVGGWMMLVYLVTLVPVLLLALLVTTVLALTQPGRPRRLTRPQAVAQLVTWAGMLLFGAVSFDFGDTEDSVGSLVMHVLGDGDLGWSVTYAAMGLGGLATVAGWTALVATLTAGRRRAAVPSEA
ncbi:hypothetical protein QWY28_17960 [Nocardioides sp. SOB77]|uniref:Transmembrane protein n=1 Tax=Nocardioides oceani TaxID=3058369 RepID=A0ABT8FJJ4_9ACTN|nr:hypothetical protein [Nocardioides oceani]MDN4174853.1 hypothetical protein [Nocardioides oceani]